MTQAQERAVERIKGMAKKQLMYGDGYEFKVWQVEELNGCGIVSVVLETGLVGDEGTLAQVFGRDRAHMFVGKRGGVTYYDYKSKAQVNRRWNWASLHEIVLAQR